MLKTQSSEVGLSITLEANLNATTFINVLNYISAICPQP